MINSLGLSIGLACALSIYLWVNDELHVDKFNKNDSRIFQVMQNNNDGEKSTQNAQYLRYINSPASADEIPEIQCDNSAPASRGFNKKGIAKLGETSIKAEGQYVTKDYLDIFSCELW